MRYCEQNLQRKTELEEALLALMGEKSYDQISVTDLTQRLQIARKTFYHYFPNKQTCLESLTDRLICQCNLEAEQFGGKQTLTQTYQSAFAFWIHHKAFLDAVIANGLEEFFLSRIMNHLRLDAGDLRKQLDTPRIKTDEDILYFFLSGQVFLLLKWCREGFPLTVEEMVSKNIRLIYEPLIQAASSQNP